jgi:integrase
VTPTLGTRRGELRGLRWSDLSGSTLTIERSVPTDYGIEWGSTKTGEERTVRVPPRLVESLRRHRKAQLEQRAAYSGPWDDPSLIFPNTRGARHDPQEIVAEAMGGHGF